MTFFRNNTIWYAFYKKVATFKDFEENSIFFEKLMYFFEKDPNFESFEKSCYFSCILRLLCYNLVKKYFHVQKREA